MNPDQPDVRMVLWLQNNKMKGTRGGQQQIALKSPEFHPKHTEYPNNKSMKHGWNSQSSGQRQKQAKAVLAKGGEFFQPAIPCMNEETNPAT